MVHANQDQLLELIFSARITSERDLHKLIFFGGHAGSAVKKDNVDWIPFLTRIRERIS